MNSFFRGFKSAIRPSMCHERIKRAFTERTYAASAIRPITESRKHSESVPIIERCPPPTCPCADMPIGLQIDYKTPLRGAMPLYSHHISVSTSRDDWMSRIEDEREGNNLAKELRKLFAPGGKLHNVR